MLVYGDCAVSPDPNPDQLADIAISSAATAAAFGIVTPIAITAVQARATVLDQLS